MAEYTIDKIEYDGNVYKLQDNISGYIKNYTETDPVFTASAAHGISSTDITNWNGKQAALVSGTNIKTVQSNSLLGSGNIKITGSDIETGGIQPTGVNDDVSSVLAYLLGELDNIPTKVSDLTNDAGYITGYTETDPVFTASAAHGITASDISNWNSKQAALVSGTNIKTINGSSLLGSGNFGLVSKSDFGTDYNNIILAGNTSCTINCSGWEGEFGANCVASVNAYKFDNTNEVYEGVIVDWHIGAGGTIVVSIASAVDYDIAVQVLLAQGSGIM